MDENDQVICPHCHSWKVRFQSTFRHFFCLDCNRLVGDRIPLKSEKEEEKVETE